MFLDLLEKWRIMKIVIYVLTNFEHYSTNVPYGMYLFLTNFFATTYKLPSYRVYIGLSKP